jgi:predicted phosphodiesterase
MASSLPTWLSNERARTALIGDIHGNFVALDAVLSDSERRGVDGVVCLGDLAAGGPQPREAIERLRDLGFAAVRGVVPDRPAGAGRPYRATPREVANQSRVVRGLPQLGRRLRRASNRSGG